MAKKIPQARQAELAKRRSLAREIFSTLVWAILIAVVLKCFIVDTRTIPSGSMEPTILTGDRVILSKLSYLGSQEPQRGDIVVFRPPAELNEKFDLIKRIIGLPGDTVEVKEGAVYINGQALAEDYLAEPPDYVYGPVTVPEDSYFVMGDNRNYSIDSHRWIDPFLGADAIKGQAIFCYWPLSHIGVI